MDKIYWTLTTSLYLADLAIRISLSLRVIMRKRAPSSSLAWLVVILLIPFAGAIIYLLFGEIRLGEIRARRAAADLGPLKQWAAALKINNDIDWSRINRECEPLHRQALAVTGLPTVAGNSVVLIDNASDFFQKLTTDINAAQRSCYLEFYIWEDGGGADDVVAALIRASKRGVECLILLDSIGSDDFLQGETIKKMRKAGIKVIEALPAGVLRALFVRVDLRNHRKIVVIDGEIAYTGSQNMVDPIYFKVHEGVGQWVDTMVRVTGPVVQIINAAFLYDWSLEHEITLPELLGIADIHPVPRTGGAAVQPVPSGPGFEEDAIHNLLLTTIYAARKELILTTPYFVPDKAILAALKSAARRNVEVTIILPEKIDSILIHYASWARFSELINSGVRIMFFTEGLLHAKTITVDSSFSLIGSVNLDMRSFWLSFELTLFIYNDEFTKQLRKTQHDYLRGAYQLDSRTLAQRSVFKKFLENCALLVGPLL